MKIDPRVEPDWTSRNWEDEARTASAVLRNFPQLYGTRVNYYLVYVTYVSDDQRRHHDPQLAPALPAIEAALDTQADDGMPLHDFYAVYVARPADLPDPANG